MATIQLNAVGTTANGVNFDKFLNGFFSDFAFQGWPYLLGGSGGNDGNQLVMLDNINGASTNMIVMDGQAFSYNSNAHIMSGTLQSITLGTLGASYKSDGSFTQDGSGRVTNVSSSVEITGLSISNGPSGGEFHNITASFMKSAGDVRQANADLLKQILAGEASNVIGSTGHDTYTGTSFSDTIRGRGGNDVLNGAGGKDTIRGDAGNDKIYGGIGADKLYGGAGRDTFIFKTTKESTKGAGGRDTVYDFSKTQGDKVNLSAIDANVRKGGNQAFTFIGEEGFHKQAGELRFQKSGSTTYVYGDVNGDGASDFAIAFKKTITFEKGDFVL
jgi:Ca2+-binding RTX toxin-like protein